MTTGSQQDIALRLRALLPTGWFPALPATGEAETAPVLMALLNGIGNQFATIWALLSYANLQTRISTSTGSFVDATAVDYFGPGGLLRNTGESDAAYIARIKASLFPIRGTRAAVVAVVTALTGAPPFIVEPRNATDCKGRGSAAQPAAGGGYGYGAPGLRYGSNSDPFQVFMMVDNGIDLPLNTLYQAIAAVLPAGSIAWVQVLGGDITDSSSSNVLDTSGAPIND